MAATAAQIAELRRMVAEPTTTTYSDATLTTYIERRWLRDELGTEPYTWDYTTTPPHQDANTDWIPTYDLNAAAADVWDEKAAALATEFDFSADGGSYSRSQKGTFASQRARYYRARTAARTVTLRMEPPPLDTDALP